MDDDKSLNGYGLTSAVAKAQQPAEVGLAFRGEEGGWEEMEKTPYSTPPELPDVMKPGQDSVAQEQTVAQAYMSNGKWQHEAYSRRNSTFHFGVLS